VNSPQRIELDVQAKTLTLYWPNGAAQCIAHDVLREACRCSVCQRLRLDRNELRAPEGIVLQEIRPIGYGLQLCFSDAHERGIFPWSYLESLPSASCTRQRTNGVNARSQHVTATAPPSGSPTARSPR